MKQEHDEQWIKFEEQQELLRKIQHMQRIQDRLRRDDERRKQNEEEERLRLAEEAELKALHVPYHDEMGNIREIVICVELVIILHNRSLRSTD
mgnify:FL=1